MIDVPQLLEPPLVLRCAGVPITACPPAGAAEAILRWASAPGPQGIDVHLCNAYTLALADKEPGFRSMLQQSSANFPDGKSLVWANQILHRKSDVPADRVYGPDLFLDVLARGIESELRHYLLGSTPPVLEALEAEIRRRFPDVNIVGVESPPFRALSKDEAKRQADRISSSGASIVWLGLGTPKQDWVASRLADELPGVFCAVGAAFDFVAGTQAQAPIWMQRHGFEWLFRLATEPRRLWKRYLFGNLRFVMAVLRRA